MSIVNWYIPTVDKNDDIKNVFYDELDISIWPNGKPKVVLGDFNVKLEKSRCTDHQLEWQVYTKKKR